MAIIRGNQSLNLPDFTHSVAGEEIFYNGNPSLRGAGHKVAYTIEHLEEFERCKKDIFYFAENYYYILDLDEGQKKIKLRDYQKEMLKSFVKNRHTIVNATRQSGKSTSFEIFVCWYVLFHSHKGVAILANKALSSLNILRKIKNAYELLPLWIQTGVKTWNQGVIEFENGCRVLAAATSSSGIRSFSINVLIIDEMAFIGGNIWSEFFSSVFPTISASQTSKIIFVSTPNGLNHFWRYWNGANEKPDTPEWNGFNPIRVNWDQVPGRDQEWYEKTKAKMTEAEFNQEFGGSFLGSSLTLISPQFLENMKYKRPIKIDEVLEMKMGDLSQFVNQYEKAKPGHTYVLACDPSKARTDTVGDPTCIQVVDITRVPYRQVCVFLATETFHYLQAPEVIYHIGRYYNWAFAFVENNDVGQAVVDALAIDWEYENVFYEKPNLAGYCTTKKTKRLGCSTLRSFIEKGKLKIVDAETIAQLSTFIKVKQSYEADFGYHDDAVMSLIGTLFFTNRPEFDAFDSRKKMGEILFNRDEVDVGLTEDLPAFGVVDAEGIQYNEEDMFF